MINYTLLNSDFNEESGISIVMIRTPLGDFEGHTIVHEEDKDIQSHFQGCRYAEMRAVLKYLNLEIKILESKIKGLTDYYNNIRQLRSFDENSKGVKLLVKDINRYIKDYNKLTTLKENIKNGLLHDMEHFREEKDNFFKKINKSKEEQEPTEE